MRTPLVGRRRELDTLLDAFERVRSGRSAQLVTLVGEPGIGKSRLVYELFQAVERDPELVYWRQGRSLPYGEGISFWALGEMVKAHAGILETDTEDEAQRKLHDVVVQTVGADDVEWTLTHLRPLAGVEDAAQRSGSQDEAFTAWRGFLEGIADESTLVLVFEDLHWADDGLLDFVDHLVDWAARRAAPRRRHRPPRATRASSGLGRRQDERAHAFACPVSTRDGRARRTRCSSAPRIPADIQATLLERSGGNPLYAEEFVRLLDERAEGAGLPETVQGIIAARLDVLERTRRSCSRTRPCSGGCSGSAARTRAR